jgi:hypothetical protein
MHALHSNGKTDEGYYGLFYAPRPSHSQYKHGHTGGSPQCAGFDASQRECRLLPGKPAPTVILHRGHVVSYQPGNALLA